ncbi:hypothetical protein LQG66_25950 [Bradyrhizobium ontarionense]|uniref:Uncharacterized protein n=1 Tax=Bradyrhizobium ontarionense TaxID=2898149 RepID=A0ABY3R5S5_9BRAD|nr:hypothetical protein [Bradyrhizobium sp. A19]UFZ02694.1 hypothetical protein LQG66_25950 [Bradyrhizobium sp. A19]
MLEVPPADVVPNSFPSAFNSGPGFRPSPDPVKAWSVVSVWDCAANGTNSAQALISADKASRDLIMGDVSMDALL